MVAEVIQIGAIQQNLAPMSGKSLLKQRKDFPLAEIAAIGRVGHKLGPGERIDGKAHQAATDLTGIPFSPCRFPGCLQGGDGMKGDRPVAEGRFGGVEQKGAVHPAGEGHRHRVMPGDSGAQRPVTG